MAQASVLLAFLLLVGVRASSVPTLRGLTWNPHGEIMVTNWTASGKSMDCHQAAALKCPNGPPCRTSFGRGTWTGSPSQPGFVQFEMGKFYPTQGNIAGIDLNSNTFTGHLTPVKAYLYAISAVCPQGYCTNFGSVIANLCPFMAVAVVDSVESSPELVCVRGNGTLLSFGSIGKKYSVVTSGPFTTHFYDEMGESYYVVAHSETDSVLFQVQLQWTPSHPSVVNGIVTSHSMTVKKSSWGKGNINPVVAIAGAGHTANGGGMIIIGANSSKVIDEQQQRVDLYVAMVSLPLSASSTVTVLGDIPGHYSGSATTADLDAGMGSLGFAWAHPWHMPTALYATLLDSAKVPALATSLLKLGPLDTGKLTIQDSWSWSANCYPLWMVMDTVG